MESPTPEARTQYDKGLKTGALGMASSVVIGVASTAPAYSLAATLGLVAAAVGLYSPAIMIVAFIPMLLIASAYYYMNRADPDCGTSFSWVTRAFGPPTGFITGEHLEAPAMSAERLDGGGGFLPDAVAKPRHGDDLPVH